MQPETINRFAGFFMSSLSITTIQTNLHWEDKTANLAMLEEKINSIEARTEIVVLPEMFNTGFSMHPERLAETMEGSTIAWMQRMAMGKKIILTGSVIIEENGNYFNRLIWMLPDGRYGSYDKRHRFGYAGEDQQFSPGNKRLIASVKGWKINLQICYDLRFPVWVRQQIIPGVSTDPEYDVIIYVANWPQRRNHAWKTLLTARAIENQCYVAGVNRIGNDGNGIYHSGDSMIIDPLGEIIYNAGEKDESHTAVLQKEHLTSVRSSFPFWNDADHFLIDPQ